MKNQESMVKISAATLNALKQMLFNKNGSVDLTPIVDDLSAGSQQNKDLIAINVGLTYKGIAPVVDATTRFDDGNTYWRYYNRYEYVSYSLILDRVTAKQIQITRDEKSDNWSEKENGVATFTYEQWLNMTTVTDKFVEDINKRCPLQDTSEE